MINLTLSASGVIISILYILLAIFVFGILILVHEFGHFITARLFKVTVKEFAIGMGPKLISHTSKKNGIRYSLRAFPIGGFVSMEGEDEDSDDPHAFRKQKAWKRLIILSAGALTNIVLGILIMTILVATPKFAIGGTTVSEIDSEYVQQQPDELLVGDRIIKVGNTRVHYYQELAYEIMNQGYEPTDLTVVRVVNGRNGS